MMHDTVSTGTMSILAQHLQHLQLQFLLEAACDVHMGSPRHSMCCCQGITILEVRKYIYIALS
jgi:hypothetical protein